MKNLEQLRHEATRLANDAEQYMKAMHKLKCDPDSWYSIRVETAIESVRRALLASAKELGEGDNSSTAVAVPILPAQPSPPAAPAYRGVIHDTAEYLQAVVFWDEIAWFASVLTKDIGAQGATPIQALWRLQVAACLDERHRCQSGAAQLDPAPPEMQARWNGATGYIGNLSGAHLHDPALAALPINAGATADLLDACKTALLHAPLIRLAPERRHTIAKLQAAIAKAMQPVDAVKARGQTEPVPKSASQGRDEVVEEMAQQLGELIETAERDMKLNQNEEPGGYWSLRTANTFGPARDALNAYRSLKHDVPDGQGESKEDTSTAGNGHE